MVYAAMQQKNTLYQLSAKQNFAHSSVTTKNATNKKDVYAALYATTGTNTAEARQTNTERAARNANIRRRLSLNTKRHSDTRSSAMNTIL